MNVLESGRADRSAVPELGILANYGFVWRLRGAGGLNLSRRGCPALWAASPSYGSLRTSPIGLLASSS